MLLDYNEGIEEILRRQDEIQKQVLMSKPKRPHRQRFSGQKYPTTCGEGSILSVLYNHYGLKFRSEDIFIELLERIYEKVNKENGTKRSRNYKIKKNGTHIYHFKNIADFLGLKVFSSNHGKTNDMKYLLKNDIWPIIFRPGDKDDPKDEGHYLVLHKHYPKSGNFKIFDPTYKGERPDDNTGIIHEGIQRIEDYEKFNYNWTYKGDNYRSYLFFCKPDADLRNLKGRFL